MKVTPSFPARRVAFALAVLTLFSGIGPFIRPARAEPIAPPAADAPAKPIEVGSVSIASLDRLGKLAGEIGVNLPSVLTPSGISQQFAFLGPDGLDPNAPIAILLYSAAGYEVAKGQGMVFVLPVKPGAAPLSNFSEAGGKPIEGHADSVDLNGATFRRTEQDLLFSPTQEAVVNVPSNELADFFKATPDGDARKSGPPLVRFAFDLNAFRRVNPDRFKSFMDATRGNTPSSKDEATRYGQNLFFSFMEELGRVEFALGIAGNDITIKLALAPANIPSAGSFPKPGMPTDVVARVDVGTSPSKLIPSLDDLLKKAAENIPLAKKKPGAPAQQKQLLKVLQAVSRLFLDGQAISVGVAPQGNGVIVYIVQQKPQANLASRLRSVADEFNKTSALVDEADDKSSVVIEHYTTSDGLSVTRAKIIEKGEPQACLDAAEKDGAVYMTMSAGDERHIESLVSRKSKGRISSLVRLEVDLDRALAAAEKSGNGKLSKMTDDQRKILADLVAGHTLNFEATGEGESIVFSTNLPKTFVAKAISLLQQGPGKGQDLAP